MGFQVCRRFRDVIDNTLSLRLLVEPGAAGYAQYHSHDSSVIPLESFRRLQRIYRNPRPKHLPAKTINLDLLIPQKSREGWGAWEKFDDYYVKTKHTVFPDNTILTFFWLGPPASVDHSLTQRQRVHVLEIEPFVRVAAIDFDQDLLVVKQENKPAIWFLSFSTGEAHNKMSPELEGKLECDHVPEVTVSSLQGELILLNERSVLALEFYGRVSLYHWPSGVLRKVSARTCPPVTLNGSSRHAALALSNKAEHRLAPRLLQRLPTW